MPRPTFRARVLACAAAVLAAAAAAASARAEAVVVPDLQGRNITFDVQAPGVDVEWYANLLRNAAHGDEITRATVRIVPPETIPGACGRGAQACYRGSRSTLTGTLVVPAGNDMTAAHALIHEYGHHIDLSHPVPGVREPNGTPSWWAARGMQTLVSTGRVAYDYILGWQRAVPEVFAEDYTQLNMQVPFGIGWLSPPDTSVLDALRADIAGAPAAPVAPPPLVVSRAGTLGAGRTQTVPFGLLGPGRRVTLTATVGGTTARGVRSRLAVVCDGAAVATRTFVRGRASVKVDRPGLGPAACTVTLRNTSKTARRYSLRLTLAIEV